MREILFKAKLKDWKTNPSHNRWIEGFYCCKQQTTYCFKEDYEMHPVKTLHYIIKECTTDWGLPNEFRFIEIDPDTLCESIGWKDNHKNKIFENDIVELVSHDTTSYKYLIWWSREMSMMDAVPLDGIVFNGTDCWNHKNPMFTYSDFCIMLQDPWGDFSDMKVIGNVFDNPELMDGKS